MWMTDELGSGNQEPSGNCAKIIEEIHMGNVETSANELVSMIDRKKKNMMVYKERWYDWRCERGRA